MNTTPRGRALIVVAAAVGLVAVVGASIKAPPGERSELPSRIELLVRNGVVPGHPTKDMVQDRTNHQPQAGGVAIGDLIFRDAIEFDLCDDVECLPGELCENGVCTPLCSMENPPGDLFIPQLSPQATGAFVNFESPQVKPVALTTDGRGLLVTNTPNNSLALLTTVGGLRQLDDIPVGYDPVAVAVRPGTNNAEAWVANMISDNISIVDIVQRRVVEVIEVGDEPVNILFTPDGLTAFVIVQGRGDPALFDSTHPEQGFVITVDAAARQVVGQTFLDLDTPRAAVYDAANQELIVAALHSGTATTTVGALVVKLVDSGVPPNANGCEDDCQCDCVTSNVLAIARDFSLTAGILAGAAELGPEYPDQHDDAAFPMASPLVHRIVPDIGGVWQQIVDQLVDAAGVPLPGVAAQMATELNLVSEAHAEDLIEIMAHNLQTIRHDKDIVVLDVSNPAVIPLPMTQEIAGMGTTLPGMGINPANGKVFVSNMEPHNLIRTEPALKGAFMDNEVIVLEPGVNRVPGGTIDLTQVQPPPGDPGGIDVTELARQNSLANPLDILFDTDDNRGYLVAFGPGRVGALNGDNAAVLGRVDVGRGPRGAALDAANDTLYVINRTDMTVMAVDVSDPAAMAVEQTVGLFNPEPLHIQQGRHFLYGTEFSQFNDLSCATCHPDADKDNENWDLGNPGGEIEAGPPNLQDPSNHPLKGPMATQTLKGLFTHEPLHWRGDKPIFQDFNPAFANLLGGAELDSDEMDAYADFIMTVVFPPSPFYNRNGTFLEGSETLKGACQFVNRCDGCHSLVNDSCFESDDGLGDGGSNLNNLNLQKSLVTQLRDIYSKFPYEPLTHDWREGIFFEGADVGHPLETFLLTFFGFTQQQRDEMISFVTAHQSNVSAATGWQVIAKGQSNRAAVENVLTTMHFQFDLGGDPVLPSQNDVTARGVIGGVDIGYVLISTNPATWRSDIDEITDEATLLDSLAAGDTLVFTAVPSGSGVRLGIDNDLDCLLNGLDPKPLHSDKGDANFDGHVDNLDFAVLVDCAAIDGPLPPECVLFDDDCGGLLDSTDFDAFIMAYEGDAADCNNNATNDILDILNGTSADNDHNAIPDECPSVVVAPSGSRYLDVVVAGAGSVAIQVADGDGCFEQYVDADGLLVDAPVFQLAADWGAVAHVRGRRIVPSHRYIVRLDSGSLGNPQLSAGVAATSWRWGDTNGDTFADLGDLVATIDAFLGAFSGVTLQGVDAAGAVPNRVVDLDDLLGVLDAAGGRSYSSSAACE
jgi:DNA-binding beta-propeller fold protein YncE